MLRSKEATAAACGIYVAIQSDLKNFADGPLFFLTFWGYCVFHKKNGLVTCVAWRLQEIVYYISWVSLTVDGREFKRQQLLLRYANLVRTGCDGSKRGLTIN